MRAANFSVQVPSRVAIHMRARAWPAPNEIGRKLRAVLRRVGIGSGGPQSPGSRERAPDVRGQLKSCTGILILEPSALCVAAKTGGAQSEAYNS